nr:RNA-directed DNA polymerase, eukaryota [Tanacetum cinerariifolium]
MARILYFGRSLGRMLFLLNLFIQGYSLLNLMVAANMDNSDLCYSLRRMPRSGVEHQQRMGLRSKVEGLILPNMRDRWYWSFFGNGEFSVASVRNFIVDNTLMVAASKTRWIKVVPKNINILAWRVKMNNLPTRFNLSRRGLDLDSILCPSCNASSETTRHIFFGCPMVKVIYNYNASWWDINILEFSSYEDWLSWLASLRMSSKIKTLLEGVFFMLFGGRFGTSDVGSDGNKPLVMLKSGKIAFNGSHAKSVDAVSGSKDVDGSESKANDVDFVVKDKIFVFGEDVDSNVKKIDIKDDDGNVVVSDEKLFNGDEDFSEAKRFDTGDVDMNEMIELVSVKETIIISDDDEVPVFGSSEKKAVSDYTFSSDDDDDNRSNNHHRSPIALQFVLDEAFEDKEE